MTIKKGQSALEFLMTYGWAMLVILIVTFVAWQLGLFSFSESIEPGYFGFWGVAPVDFKLTTSGVLSVSLVNMVGSNVTIVGGNVSMGPIRSDIPIGRVIKAGSTSEPITVSNLAKGNLGTRYEVFLIVEYNDTRTGDTVYRSSGRIWGTYEE